MGRNTERKTLEALLTRQDAPLFGGGAGSGFFNVSGLSRVVLLVEDEWLLRQLLVDEFDAAGWTVMEASSGESALDFLRNGTEIDVLVTDVRLGTGMTGWDVAAAFRASRAELPVVYVSANASTDPRRVEGSIFLNKPCVIETLLAACRTLCAK